MHPIEEGTKRLLAGQSADEVLDLVRAHFAKSKTSKPFALKNCIDRIRKATIAQMPQPNVDSMHAFVGPFGSEPGVAEFLAASVKEKLAIQKKHRYDKSWSAAAETALAALELVPENVAQFVLSKEEAVATKRVSKEHLQAKQATTIIISDGAAMLNAAQTILQSPNSTLEELSIALLIVTGRRQCELMNGKSHFTPAVHPFACVFDGQIKVRYPNVALPYVIPLLAPSAVVRGAIDRLRQLQGDEVVGLDNEAVTQKYHYGLTCALKRIFPGMTNVHKLRALYANYVFTLYTASGTFNDCCMRVLGHSEIEDSLCYNNFKIHGLASGAWGPLPVA